MLPDAAAQPLLRPAELLSLHPDLKRTALYGAIKGGQLPSLRIGSRIYLPTAAVAQLLHLDRQHVVTGPGDVTLQTEPCPPGVPA